MRNSSELAESRRRLTANVEKKWLSNLHENVNSAKPQNANTRSGTLPELRERNLPLPKLLSLDAFCAQMAPHIFGNPNQASHILTHLSHSDMPFRAFMHPDDPSVDFMRLDESSVDFMRPEEPSEAFVRLEEPCRAQWCPLVLTSRDGELRS